LKCLGIDWGSELHALALLDESGSRLEEWELEHDPEAVDRLVDRLAREGGPGEVEVALEPGPILLMQGLLDAGYTLYPINPKQLDRYRDRFFPSGAKDDSRDAWVAARALATDRDRLQAFEPESEEAEELLERAAARQRLIQRRVACGNQLLALLKDFYPAPLKLKRDVDDAFFLDLLEAYPDPLAARRSRSSRVGRLLAKRRLRVLSLDAVMGVLHGPAFRVRPSRLAASRDELLDLVAQMRQLNEQIHRAEKRMEALFEDHPDRELLLSLPGMGMHLAIRVGLKLGRDRIERHDASTLQSRAGTAPVTKFTGKKPKGQGRRRYGRHVVLMRRACDRQLQADANQWAGQSVRCSRWAQAFYTHQRTRGAGHNTALRALANKWIKILAAVIRTGIPYDEEHHIQALRAHGVPWAAALATPNTEAA